jgi:ParB-like nuclease domain
VPDLEILAAETVPLADLRPHPKNYRIHPPDQIAHIAHSLEEFGQYRNVVVARDLTILAGHGVVAAAATLNWRELTVVRIDLDPADPKALKVLAGDNELGHLAEIDDRQLAEHLRVLASNDDLLGTGYDETMLANLVYVTRAAGEIATLDAAAHWAGLPGFEASANDRLLVLHFETDKERDEAIGKLGVTISKKTRDTWSAYYPPRPRQDLASLRFE